MDCSPPGSSAHGIPLQARILELVAIPFSRGSTWPKDPTWVSCTADGFFTIWDTREAQILMPKTLWETPPSQAEPWAVNLESYKLGVNMSHFIRAGHTFQRPPWKYWCEETLQDRGSWKEGELSHVTGVIRENKNGGASSGMNKVIQEERRVLKIKALYVDQFWPYGSSTKVDRNSPLKQSFNLVFFLNKFHKQNDERNDFLKTNHYSN